MVVTNPLARSAATVGIFWWAVLTGTAFWNWPTVFLSSEGSSLILWFFFKSIRLLVCASLGAVLVVVLWHAMRFALTKKDLRAGAMRGMSCTVGDPPIARSTLPRARVIPAWFSDAEQIEYGQTLMAWMKQASGRHPAHVELMQALIRTLCMFSQLPASHIARGHGGKSLVDHSARVAGMALRLAPSFRYDGLKTKYGSTPRRDAGFQFDGGDPLIPLIGFAHDLGKIGTFTLDRKGRVTGSRPGHDKVGARLLALMDETYGLPPADRSALFRAIANYHHPSDYPLTQDGRLDDDRTVALMMLLIQADKAAGKHEGNHYLPPAEYAAFLEKMRDMGEELDQEQLELIEKVTGSSAVGAVTGAGSGPSAKVAGGKESTITDEQMAAALMRLLVEPGVIARHTKGVDVALMVGQLNTCDLPQWAWDIREAGEELDATQSHELGQYLHRRILISEPKLRSKLAQVFGVAQPMRLGDGRYLLTVRALRVLHQMGLLDTAWQGGFISVESALFEVSFLNRNTRSRIAGWKAILLLPNGPFASWQSGAEHDSYFRIDRPMWKDRRARTSGAPGAEIRSEDRTPEYAPDAGSKGDDRDADEQANHADTELGVVTPAMAAQLVRDGGAAALSPDLPDGLNGQATQEGMVSVDGYKEPGGSARCERGTLKRSASRAAQAPAEPKPPDGDMPDPNDIPDFASDPVFELGLHSAYNMDAGLEVEASGLSEGGALSLIHI